MTIRLLATAALLALACSAPLRASAQEVVPVVSARSPVTSLNEAQVADIFLGKTSRFPDGMQAMPIDLAEESPARERFYAQFTGKSPAQVKAHWSKIIFTGRGQPPRQASTGAEARRIIADNPHAIGYIERSLVDSSVRIVALR
jgi:ABC-type phosphate transport system substrate-binding protein